MTIDSDSATTPMFNDELEGDVLGALILDAASMLDGLPLRGSTFWNPRHRQVFEAIRGLVDAQIPLDYLTLTRWLTDRFVAPPDEGWIAYLMELSNRVTSAAYLAHHARALRELEDRRTMRELCGRSMKRNAELRDEEFPAFIDEHSQGVFDLAHGRAQHDQAGAVQVHKLLAELLAADNKKQTEAGTLTGFHAVDEILGSLPPFEMTVVGACTGLGKSVFLQTAATNASKQRRINADGHSVDDSRVVLYFSVEMGNRQTATRIAASATQIDSRRIMRGEIDDNERSRLNDVRAQAEENDTPLFIADSIHSLAGIALEVRRVSRRRKVDVIFVDYLQLLSAQNPKEPREIQVSGISRGLKRLAADLEVHVVAAAQLNRQADGCSEPQLWHLRESGSLAQDASNVILLYRKPEDTKLEVFVRKNRNGKLGKVELYFDLEHQRILNAAPTSAPIYAVREEAQ